MTPQTHIVQYLEGCNDEFSISTIHLPSSSILPQYSKQSRHNTMNVRSEGRERGTKEREKAVE